MHFFLIFSLFLHVILTRHLHYYLNAQCCKTDTEKKWKAKSNKYLKHISLHINSYLFKSKKREEKECFKWKLSFTLEWHKQTIKIHTSLCTHIFPRRKINTLHAITYIHEAAEFILGLSPFLPRSHSLTSSEAAQKCYNFNMRKDKLFILSFFLASIDKWTAIYFVYKHACRWKCLKLTFCCLKILSYLHYCDMLRCRSIMITVNRIKMLQLLKIN